MERPGTSLEALKSGAAGGDREIDLIVQATESEQLKLIVPLAVETAMRRSKLLSIQWENVDLDRRLHRPGRRPVPHRPQRRRQPVALQLPGRRQVTFEYDEAALSPKPIRIGSCCANIDPPALSAPGAAQQYVPAHPNSEGPLELARPFPHEWAWSHVHFYRQH